jgi:FkbM family methyltransferase
MGKLCRSIQTTRRARYWERSISLLRGLAIGQDDSGKQIVGTGVCVSADIVEMSHSLLRTWYPWPIAKVILPATRFEWPGWGSLGELFDLFNTNADGGPWKNSPTKIMRGKLHGYLMELDLNNWSERQTYFLGRFYELGTQQMMMACLKPGDRFVDIGANMGMLTLLGAALVGAGGRVDAFEPNPKCQQRIRANLARNSIQHVFLHDVALGSERQTLELQVMLNHTGSGTLGRMLGEEEKLVTEHFSVPVVPGDEVLLGNDQAIALVKIDVEGFEASVLRGMPLTLERWHPLVTTELVDGNLKRVGSTAQEVIDLMTRMGYRGYHMTSSGPRGKRPVLHLRGLDGETTGLKDILWAHGQSAAWPRLANFVDA